MIRVLVTGSNGQLGRELLAQAPPNLRIHACDRSTLDITSRKHVTEALDAIRPDWIVNTAAYTAVDEAEKAQREAYEANRDGPANLAQAAARTGTRLIQISTDYVFDGTLGRPCRPEDSPRPVNVYGASKRAGEMSVLEALGERALILRTAWVYSAHGHNFLNSMLRLMSERETLGIVEDQIGTPTSTLSLAEVIFKSIDQGIHGIHHWTDAGVASWYDFAVAIHSSARMNGLLEKPCELKPIPSSDFPTLARRPADSRLDKSSLRQALDVPSKSWIEALDRVMEVVRK